MLKVERHIRTSPQDKVWIAGPGARWVFRWLLVLFCGIQVTLAAAAPVSKEYQVKAAFLYNFTKFVTWAPDRFSNDESPIVIGVLGKNPFGEDLNSLVQHRKVNGRGFAVRTVNSEAECASVHLLFIPHGEELRLTPRNVNSIEMPGVLTIGESKQFAERGGIINFVTEADKVRFEINREAAAQASVRLSAQLLKLAMPPQTAR